MCCRGLFYIPEAKYVHVNMIDVNELFKNHISILFRTEASGNEPVGMAQPSCLDRSVCCNSLLSTKVAQVLRG